MARLLTIIFQILGTMDNAAQVFLFVGLIRVASEKASIESQFSTVLMCMFRFAFMIQAYIISCFVANGNICD